MLPLRANPPSWIYPAARFDFDFANQRYWGANLSMKSGNGTNARMQSFGVEANNGGNANTYYRPDPSGIWLGNQAQFNPPVTGYGLWEEGYNTDTNWCLQNRDWTNAVWTKVTTTAARTQVGADGKVNSATLLTATSAAATVLQTISQPAISATVASGGIATYVVGDLLTVVGGTGTAAIARVTTVGAGLPTVVTLIGGGASVGSYSITPTNPVATTGGGGTGCTLNLTFDTYCPSVIMKRSVGTGAVSITLDGTVYTQIDASINSTTFTQVTATAAAKSAIIFGIKIATNGDAVTVDFGQVENNPVATSPIVTTTVAVGRCPEALYVNNSTVANAGTADNDGYRVINDIEYGTPATVLVQYSGNFDPTHGHLLWGDALGNTLFISSTGGGGNVIQLVTQSGTLTSADSDVSGLLTNTGTGKLNKVIVRVDGSGSAICVNGGQITKSSSIKYSSPVTVPAGMTHGGWLNNGSNGLPTNGYLARSTFWRKAVTDGEMIQYST